MPLTLAGTIGTIRCHGWVGTMLGLQAVPDIYTRTGGKASGSQEVGSRAPISSILTSSVFTSKAQATKARADIQAMINSTVAVVDSYGQKWAQVRVNAVTPVMKGCRGPGETTGTNATHRIECEWSLEVLA